MADLPGTAVLPIHEMDQRHRGLTKAVAASYLEAARVCLGRRHEPPVQLTIEDSGTTSPATADWTPPDERTKTAWANQIDATEAGACACVIAAVELTRGLFAIGRAETLTGADYYVASAGEVPVDDLEICWRLEISGSDRDSGIDLERRLRRKLEQARVGKGNLPALAGVVGFSAISILIGQVTTDDLG